MKRILFAFSLVSVLLFSTASGCSKEEGPSQPEWKDNKEDDPKKDPDPTPEPGQDTTAFTLDGKKFIVCANSMVYYGGFVQHGSQKSEDPGMFSKLIKAHGYKDVKIIDNTWGGHHLMDYLPTGDQTSSDSCPGVGQDLLAGLDLGSFDYVILSEAGNNYDHFYSDAVTVFNRFTAKNPNAKLYYINHIYSVYKKHTNVLNNLKTLHDQLGVTIVNCGQLAYDIYSGAVKVPGGNLSYSDRYTFCNHTSSDTYHPNPLMGFIMTQMTYCAVTGETAAYEDYMNLVQGSYFATGSVSYSAYYDKYYPNPAALPFYNVLQNQAEMKGIQELIPQYINKY